MGLADMAAKSAVLRVDMGKAVSSAEELYKPEKAQSFVNTLSRLGATGSAELMNVERVRYLARNEPAKLQEEIAKMSSKFVDETGKMSAIGMDFLKEIASESGYSADELAKMGVSMSQLQEKQDLINTTGLQLSDPKEMEKLTNLLTKGKDGKFEVTYEQDGQQVTKALQDMNAYEKTKLEEFLSNQNKQIKETFEAKPGEDKNLVKLVEQQMDVNTKFTKAIDALATVIPSQIAGSKTGEKMIQSIIDNTNKLSTTALSKLDELSDEAGKVVDAKIDIISQGTTKLGGAVNTMVDKMQTFTGALTTTLTPAVNTFSDTIANLATKVQDVFKLNDFVSFPGDNRILSGPEGTFEVNENDTIIAGTDFPKTKEEIKKMMENLRSPQNTPISSPIETKPLLIPENMGMSVIEKQREKALTDIMMSSPITQKEGETTQKELKTTNDINHKLDMTIDLKNVPTNINQNDLKNTLETAIKQPEFLNKLREGMKSIDGTNFY
jgi:hypothetical protein